MVLRSFSIGVGLSVVGGAALATDEPLETFFTGASSDGSIIFALAADDCVAEASLTQNYEDGSVRTSLTQANLAHVEIDPTATGVSEMLDVAQISVFRQEDAAPFEMDLTMTTSRAGVRTEWAAQGAMCEDLTCHLTVTQDAIPLIIAGPAAGARLEAAFAALEAAIQVCTNASSDG